MYIEIFQKYKPFLEQGTYENQDWSYFKTLPKSRAETFEYCFINFVQNIHKVVVELGTLSSFCHGGDIRCGKNDKTAWQPNLPSSWDWGAGFFTRMAAESLVSARAPFMLHTVDCDPAHIEMSKLITLPFKKYLRYVPQDSVDFLKNFHGKIDLLYMDTGYVWPLSPSIELSLAEAKVVVERDLISPYGLILIDDVRNTTPKKFGEPSDLGKGKLSIPYFLEHGFEVVMDEYQVILRRKDSSC